MTIKSAAAAIAQSLPEIRQEWQESDSPYLFEHWLTRHEIYGKVWSWLINAGYYEIAERNS